MCQNKDLKKALTWIREPLYSFKGIYWEFSMKVFVKVIKALSDPNRVKIIKLLQHKCSNTSPCVSVRCRHRCKWLSPVFLNI
jgi:hypothetical protein